MAIKKGPTKGSGGKHRNKLKGYGPTPKAEDRVYHKAYKAKKAAERRQMADPRLAARRRVDKFASADTSDLVYGRNSVLEALRVGVPSSTLYIMSRIEHDDRTREIVKIAGMNGLHMLEADRLEMDRIARSGNHQGVILKVDPFQYSSLNELADRAEKKAKAMEAANSAAARIAARPLFIALDGVTDPQNLGAVIRSAAAFGANGVILPERRSASVNAAAWKVSAGAAAHMPVARVVNLTKALEGLKERGYYVVGLDGGGDKLVGGHGAGVGCGGGLGCGGIVLHHRTYHSERGGRVVQVVDAFKLDVGGVALTVHLEGGLVVAHGGKCHVGGKFCRACGSSSQFASRTERSSG